MALASAANAETLILPRLGTVSVTAPARRPAGVVILFSDPSTADAIADETLNALAEAGQAVAVVDSGAYLKRLDREKEDCSRVVEDLAGLKAGLLRRFGLPENIFVVLAGPGAGGALAYGVLAQSTTGQFAGAVAFNFKPDLPARRPLCAGAPHSPVPGGFRYLPVARLGGFWRIATASPDDETLLPYVQGDSKICFPLRPYDDLASAIIGVIADETHPPDGADQGIGDLPLVLLPVDRPARTMAVIYSGDGGWRDLDKQIGMALQQAGIPVVGVDTLRSFWTRRTPAAASRDLERILGHFTRAWNTPDVLLIGYSFGADIIPFMVNRIKPAVRDHIRQITLLGLSHDAAFEIHMSGWLGAASSSDALPLKPELARLDRRRVQCFVGMDELAESGCTDPALAGAEIVKTAGGHHFDGDYRKLARTIIAGAVRRGAAAAIPANTD